MKKTELLLEIARLAEILNAEISASEELRIEAESSFSEAVIVGSREAYLRAAIAFLQISISGSTSEAFDVKPFFNELAAAWPVAAYVAENDDDAQALARKFINI